MAGDFARRVNACADKHAIPIHYCELGDKTKHARAEKFRPQNPNFPGVFLILVAKAPTLVWQAKPNRHGMLVLRRPQSWPLVCQGLIDRTRRLLDVPRPKTIFGRKPRPHHDRAGGGRLEKSSTVRPMT
jgi:hypothetical protein